MYAQQSYFDPRCRICMNKFIKPQNSIYTKDKQYACIAIKRLFDILFSPWIWSCEYRVTIKNNFEIVRMICFKLVYHYRWARSRCCYRNSWREIITFVNMFYIIIKLYMCILLMRWSFVITNYGMLTISCSCFSS